MAIDNKLNTSSGSSKRKRSLANIRNKYGRGMRIISVVLLISATLLVASLALYLSLGSDNDERKYIDKTKFQAVFLNNGQAFFGKIRTLNNRFFTLDNIYYLQVNEKAQSDQTAVAPDLIKFGCAELHSPTDVIVINREQIVYWENLKDDGKVVEAISAYVKKVPKGETCIPAPTTTETTE